MVSELRAWLRLRIADLLARRDEQFASRAFGIARTCVLGLAAIYAAIIIFQIVNRYGPNGDALLATVERLNADTYDMSALAAAQSRVAEIGSAHREILLCAPRGENFPGGLPELERLHRLIADQVNGRWGYAFVKVRDAAHDNWQVVFYIHPGLVDPFKIRYSSAPDQFFCAEPFRELDRFSATL
jgi:hypothetical protein